MTSDALILPSPAKLNQFLHITGQRSDGYHELQTAFQLLDYGDTVQLRARTDNKIILLTSLEGVPDKDNIVIRAAQLLQTQLQTPDSRLGVEIKITKRIPIGGGLGGGSSNAASTLLGLNQLWQLGLSLDQLAAFGLRLGADVPVFIYGNSSFGEGIGEQLQPLAMPKCWFAVIKPPVTVPTATIFSHPQLTRDTRPIRIAAVFKHPQKSVLAKQSQPDSGDWNPELRNDCEKVVRKEYPEIDKALGWLNQFSNARLTGTGACVFASFASHYEARAVLQAMPATYTGFAAQSTDRSIAHKVLNEWLRKRYK